jgi:hypothetical protein
VSSVWRSASLHPQPVSQKDLATTSSGGRPV